MERLIVVSNRVPDPKARQQAAGGLAVALERALAAQGGIWFGWNGKIGEPGEPDRAEKGEISYVTTPLTTEEHRGYYLGHSNRVLWPICHYELGLVSHRHGAEEIYRRVNARFARLVKPLLEKDDLVWVHDYHLFPLGAELRKLGVHNPIGFFLHIPFPAANFLMALPNHMGLIGDLAAYDLVGLQAARDVEAAREFLIRFGGAREVRRDTLAIGQQTVKIGHFPISIDVGEFAALAADARSAPVLSRLNASLRGRMLMLGVDRTDYTKGLVRKVEAFGDLLRRYPEHRDAVTFMQVAAPSRGDVPEYSDLKRELDLLAGRILGEHSDFDWVPIRYLGRTFARPTLAQFYRRARVGCVTPLRDGMNLVAKEYVASQDPEDPGVLILSTLAGAAEELDAALLVSPVDHDGLVEAMHRALVMPLEERITRWRALHGVIAANSLANWTEKFLAGLRAARTARAAA